MSMRNSIENLARQMVESYALEDGFENDIDGIQKWIKLSAQNKEERNSTVGIWKHMPTAKTILFSSDQIDVFYRLKKTYTNGLDYRLPFPDTFIQLSKPYSVRFDGIGEISLVGMLLTQEKIDKQTYDCAMETYGREGMVKIDFGRDSMVLLNTIYVIAKDGDIFTFGAGSWHSDTFNQEFSGDKIDGYGTFVDLAISCVGYINCENIYLERQGEVPESVNRKREAKGKSRLEPYYVCRIRGLQYDSVATGEGSKHGIRYDVRGHFRRISDERTIWVRPHQRGLQNELYIPKTYKVDKGSKPAWKP